MAHNNIRFGRRALVALACTFVTASWASAGMPRGYDMVALGPIDHISAMNEDAEIVGSMTSGGVGRAFVISEREVVLLPLLDRMISSAALDINEWGEIVGTVSASADAQVDEHAAIWYPDGQGGYKCELLGSLSGDTGGVATAINDLGDIVGISVNQRGSRAVLFTPDGKAVDLSASGLRFPSDVNEERIIVDSSPNGRTFDLKTMALMEITPSSDATKARSYHGAYAAHAINDRNQIAGTLIRTFDKGCRQYAARYSSRSGWQAISNCGAMNSAWDINNQGDVLMEVDGAIWMYFDGVGGLPLSDLVKSDWRDGSLIKSNAGALNDSGQVAIVTSDPLTGERAAFLLTPQLAGAPTRERADLAASVR